MVHGGHDGLEHRRREKEIGEVRIELRATSFLDTLGSLTRASPLAVAPTKGDGVERIGDRDDPRGEGDARAAQLRRITASIPPLMMMTNCGDNFNKTGLGELSDKRGAVLCVCTKKLHLSIG